jgi:hypothetical protein
MTFKIKPNTIYRLLSKDKYNNSYFWVENLYYVNNDINEGIEEFHFFINSYINSNVSVNIQSNIIIWEDLVYTKGISESLNVLQKIQNYEWVLYEIKNDELQFIKNAETKLLIQH